MKLLCLILLSFFVSGSASADKGQHHWYMDFDFRAADSLVCGRQQTFALALSRNKTTTAPSFSIRFETFGGITLREKTTWHETLDDRPMFTRKMHMIVPCGDTSGILFWVDFGTGEQLVVRSFIPTTGGFTMIPFDARVAAKLEREKGDTLGYVDSADESTLNQAQAVSRDTEVAREQLAESLSVYSDTAGWQKLPGGGWGRTRKMTQAEIDYGRMRNLESAPCKDSIQYFVAEGKSYCRRKGEWMFHSSVLRQGEIPGVIIRDAHRLKYDIIVQATDSSRLALVLHLTKGYAPTALDGFYRVRVDTATHHQLEIGGIKCFPSYAEPNGRSVDK
ncbi:MAG: hypothetical protein HY851_04455 [candidate division Zixibacteria bacterium]|nr:hypothetical protein [candidate division Zixibacteria bacterium]